MWPVTAAWLTALSASHGRYTRVEAWYAGVKVASFQPESGGVQVTARNRVRRQVKAVVAEKNWPTTVSSALAPYGARLRVWQGITGANGQLLSPEVPVFGGRVETVQRDRKSGRITVTGLDPFGDINDAQFEQPFAAAAGAGVVATIIQLVSAVVPTATVVDLTGSSAQLPITMMWDTDRGKAVDDLAAAIGAEVFFLPDDTTCVIRPVPVIGGTPVWSLVQGQGSTIVRDAASRSRTDVANRIIVHVEQPGQTPFTVTVTDDNPASATRFGGPYGKVVRHMTNPLIASAGQAAVAGFAKLARSIGATRTRDVDHVPNPALEGGDLISIGTDEGTEQHIADAFTLPFAVTDVMTTNTRSTGTSVS